uniref:26S proteasome non-ATPase regulatory subunit 8 n=1 Tax=Oryctolagus cuniculus TaxID=9986 RepID=A0A5F9D2K0_RABIT
MFIKGRARRAPPRERQQAASGGPRKAALAPPLALGSTSKPHFRRARGCRRRCRKSGRRFAASRKMAAATVNGATGVPGSGTAAASGAVLQAAAGMYEQLKGEWNRKSPNLSKCGEELGRLKLVLLELNFLPTTGTKLTKQQLILARDILEIGAQWSILRKDIPSFERYMAQLKCYYFDYKEQLPESAYMHQLLGLNLLFLLSQNRVAEFHTELERLPARDIQTNVYIKHPVSLEQYLMEGSYNKVFLAKGNIPAESYTFFIDILLDTIRCVSGRVGREPGPGRQAVLGVIPFPSPLFLRLQAPWFCAVAGPAIAANRTRLTLALHRLGRGISPQHGLSRQGPGCPLRNARQ